MCGSGHQEFERLMPWWSRGGDNENSRLDNSRLVLYMKLHSGIYPDLLIQRADGTELVVKLFNFHHSDMCFIFCNKIKL